MTGKGRSQAHSKSLQRSVPPPHPIVKQCWPARIIELQIKLIHEIEGRVRNSENAGTYGSDDGTSSAFPCQFLIFALSSRVGSQLFEMHGALHQASDEENLVDGPSCNVTVSGQIVVNKTHFVAVKREISPTCHLMCCQNFWRVFSFCCI